MRLSSCDEFNKFLLTRGIDDDLQWGLIPHSSADRIKRSEEKVLVVVAPIDHIFEREEPMICEQLMIRRKAT